MSERSDLAGEPNRACGVVGSGLVEVPGIAPLYRPARELFELDVKQLAYLFYGKHADEVEEVVGLRRGDVGVRRAVTIGDYRARQ